MVKSIKKKGGIIMEITIIISLISMTATIISTIFTIKAKREVIKIHNEFKEYKNNNAQIVNTGVNSGVQAQSITGGVKFGHK